MKRVWKALSDDEVQVALGLCGVLAVAGAVFFGLWWWHTPPGRAPNHPDGVTVEGLILYTLYTVAATGAGLLSILPLRAVSRRLQNHAVRLAAAEEDAR